MPGALPQVVHRCAQVHDGATRAQSLAVGLAQYRPAAGGEHDVVLRGELVDDGRLARTEARFAFEL